MEFATDMFYDVNEYDNALVVRVTHSSVFAHETVIYMSTFSSIIQ